MIHLRTLGSIELTGCDPEDQGALLAQPGRVALLAFIALGAGGGPVSREALVGRFWPDGPRKRGRGALRNALHFLRRRLGPESVVSRGDDLALDPRLVECDALAFARYLEEGRAADALSLYRGDLLPGLDGAAGAGFEAWLEGERGRVRRRAAEVAWVCATEAEERRQWISAVDHARRATELAADELALRRLMRLLERAGDGVAAIREYEAHVERWAREADMAPSSETSSLARAIRARCSEPASSRGALGTSAGRGEPESAVPASGIDRGRSTSGRAREPGGSIAVLPFLLTGSAPPDEHLAAGLTHGLIASLSRLSSIRVVARGSVDRYVRDVGVRTGSPIASELGVGTLLQGSIGVSGGRLAVAAQLVDARTGAPIWAEIYEREPGDLLELQGDLVRTVLDMLGAPLSTEEDRRIAGQPTAHPEAWERYLEGRLELGRRSRKSIERAIAKFEEALAVDPEFALAFAGLADAYLLLWPLAGVRLQEARVRAREAARAALRADPRLGEAHATLGLLRGVMDRDWYGAEADFRRAIELSPGHATARHWYGAYLTFVGRRFDDGWAELELAHQLDPLSPIILTDMGLALLHRRRSGAGADPGDWREAFERALTLDPGLWRAHHDLGVAEILDGDPESGAEHLARAWRLGAHGRASSTAEPEPGGWRAGLERRLSEVETAQPQREMRGFEAILLSALLGRDAEALTWLDAVADEGSWGMVMQYLPAFDRLAGRPAFGAALESAGLRPPARASSS